MGLAITLPVLMLFWAYNRAVMCWAHGRAGTFEFLICPNSGAFFGAYVVVVLAALMAIHWPVAVDEGSATVDVSPLPWFARVRPRSRRERYRSGFQRLDQHTRETLAFADWLVPVVVGLALVLVAGIPRLLG